MDKALNAALADAVTAAIDNGGECGLQVAIYAGGALAAEAFGGVADVTTGAAVTRDTLFPIFSVCKALTATALHLQAERGLIDYDAPIARYWPQFAVNGKDKATVMNALQHRLGLYYMPEGTTPERFCDYDWMTSELANLTPKFQPGTKNGYMSYTFGWIVAEIVRRTDPMARDFRKFLRDEILGPLAIDDFWIGLDPSRHSRVARLIDPPARPNAAAEAPALAMPAQVGARQEIYGRKDVREACIPGANGIANARSVARFFALLSGGGALGGVRLLSKERVATFSKPRADADLPDTVLGYPARVGAGFWTGGNTHPENYCRIMGDDRRLLGHPGTGGSIAWADPTHDVAVAICHNRMFNAPSNAYDAIQGVVDRLIATRARSSLDVPSADRGR